MQYQVGDILVFPAEFLTSSSSMDLFIYEQSLFCLCLLQCGNKSREEDCPPEKMNANNAGFKILQTLNVEIYVLFVYNKAQESLDGQI